MCPSKVPSAMKFVLFLPKMNFKITSLVRPEYMYMYPTHNI